MSLSSMLVERGVATIRQVEEALARQVIYGSDLATNLLEVVSVDETLLLALLADAYDLPAVEAGALPIPEGRARGLVPPDLCSRRSIAPLALVGDVLSVAVVEPLPEDVVGEVGFALGLRLDQRVALQPRIRQALTTAFAVPLERRFQRILDRLEGLSSGTMTSIPPLYSNMPPAPSPAALRPAGVPNSAPRPSVFGPLSPSGLSARVTPRPEGDPPPASFDLTRRRMQTSMPMTPRVPDTSGRPGTPAPPTALGSGGPPSGAGSTRSAPYTADFPPAGRTTSVTPAYGVKAVTPIPPAGAPPHGPILGSRSSRPLLERPPSTSAASRSTRPTRRRRGPMTLEKATRELENAGERDALLDLLFDFARQYFDYTAVFLVHGDLAEGREADGPGASRDHVITMGIPLELPSLFQTARDRGAAVIAVPAREGLDVLWQRDLERPGGHPVVVLPIVVRTRVVALLYGDNGEFGIDADTSGEVIAFSSAVGKAFQKLIVRRKAQALGRQPMHPTVPAGPPDMDFGPEPEAAETRLLDPRPVSGGAARVNAGAPPPATLSRDVRAQFKRTLDYSEPVERPPSGPVAAVRKPSVPPIPREEAGAAAPRVERVSTRPEAIAVAPEEPADAPWVDAPPGFDSLERLHAASPELEAGALDDEGARALLDELERESMNDLGIAEPFSAGHAVVVPAHKPPARVDLPVELPSVIIDADSEMLAAVDALIAKGSDETIEADLVHRGKLAMPALVARFPGPIDEAARIEAEAFVARASECGPVLRVIAGQRRVALPFVLSLLEDADEDRRFWATLLLAELPYPEALPALTSRLLDGSPKVFGAARFAAKVFVRTAGDAFVDALGRIAANPSETQERRARVLSVLVDVRAEAAVPLLMGLLADLDGEIASAARQGLGVLARQDFLLDAAAWRTWWTDNNKRHRVEWLIDALTHPAAAIRKEASVELRALTKEYFGYTEDLPVRERARAQQRYRDWWITEGRLRFARG